MRGNLRAVGAVDAKAIGTDARDTHRSRKYLASSRPRPEQREMNSRPWVPSCPLPMPAEIEDDSLARFRRSGHGASPTRDRRDREEYFGGASETS